MCGIVGTLSCHGGGPVEARTVRRMLAAIRHRGPDEFGVYLFNHQQCSLGLGNARLSIIDLAGGQQPISNEDGTKWIVFNGEIFNYIELRKQLEGLGHRMATDCDTEVVLHLFEQYGPECLEHLNGQFALAIWDETAGELFLARDRCGIRPLYYTRQAGRLVFASEIKAILAHDGVSAELDPVAIDQVFTYWSAISPRTAFGQIRSLPPGHWLTVGRDGEGRDGEVGQGRYFRVAFPAAGSEPHRNLDTAADQLRELLIDAIRLRLRADVPVGAYLSGGLDSSAITALTHRCTSNRLETFSIAFTDKAFDESDFQWQMARHLGTRHHLITCSHADIGRVFPDVVRHAETPIMRTGPAPLFMLSELVRKQGFKVVLTGEGADEFLAGYNLFKEAKVRRFWARQPDSAGRPALLGRLYQYIADLPSGNIAYLRKFFGQGLAETSSPTYSHDLRWRNTGRTKRLFCESMQTAIARAAEDSSGAAGPSERGLHELDLPGDFDRLSPLAQAQYLEAAIFLPEYLLSSQGDRMGMAHSVEGRFPFLDHRVIEFCGRLAPRLKLCGLNEKHLLKHAMREMLPEVVCARRKQPYRAPIHASFFPDGKPLPWVSEAVSAESLESAGCFNPSAVGRLVKKVERFGSLGETDDMALAGVLSTQLVHRQFVADFRTPADLSAEENVKTVIRTGRSPVATSQLPV